MSLPPKTTHNEEPPPFLGTWKRMYWFVILLHALLIFLFWLFTKSYS